MPPLSTIAAAGQNLAAADGLVGVVGGHGGTPDVLFSPAQLLAALWSLPINQASLNNIAVTAPAAPAILALSGSATANVSFNLPAATPGALYVVTCGAKSTGTAKLTANGTDFIRYAGTAGGAGGNIAAPATGNASGILLCVTSGAWHFFGSGTWVVS